MILSASIFCQELLPIVGKFKVHSAFEHAINIELTSTRLLSLVSSPKPLIPFGVVVPTPDLYLWVEPEQFIIIDRRHIYIAEHTLRLTGEGLSTKLSHETTPDLAHVRHFLGSLLLERTPGFALLSEAHSSLLQSLENHYRNSDLNALILNLLGLGPGLTPSGDDFLVGVVWAWTITQHPWLESLHHAILTNLHRTHEISAHFLRLAIEQRFIGPLLSLANPNSIRLASRELLAQGATSGADTARGILWGLSHQACLQPPSA